MGSPGQRSHPWRYRWRTPELMGMPCPNLSTGGYGFHGVYECIPVQALEQMPKILADLVCSFAE